MKYRVTCFILGSDKELEDRKMAERLLKVLAKSIDASPRASSMIASLESEHPGMVLKDFVIQSPGQRSIKEMLAGVRLMNPEAILASWDEIKTASK